MIEKIKELVNSKFFLKELEISGNVVVEEIRKGKVNHIFKLIDAEKNISYILKKSDIHLAGLNSPAVANFNISVLRNYTEAKVLQYITDNISHEYVPKVLMTNKEEAYFVMEFLNDYRDVRDIFLSMNIPNNFAEDISDILSKIYINTADITEEILGVDNRCMVDILLMLLTKAPYEINIVEGNKSLVDVKFFTNNITDPMLLANVMQLSYKLKNCKQALLNGDLHLGSIFYNESCYKIYDFEFAFKGPIGYEIGKIIAHLILAYYYALSKANSMVAKNILQEIADFYDKFFKKLEKDETFFNPSIKEDTVKFCGLELISRVTGILQLKYINNISNTDIKDKTQKKIFEIGTEMVKGQFKIITGKEFIDHVR